VGGWVRKAGFIMGNYKENSAQKDIQSTRVFTSKKKSRQGWRPAMPMHISMLYHHCVKTMHPVTKDPIRYSSNAGGRW